MTMDYDLPEFTRWCLAQDDIMSRWLAYRKSYDAITRAMGIAVAMSQPAWEQLCLSL